MNDISSFIVGLDIGTTKVCAIVAEQREDGGIEIMGVGTSPSNGLKRGVVINIDKTVESIRKAVDEAERMAGCEIENVFVGIAGGHIQSSSGHGMITLRNREVTPKDVERVIESANAVTIPADREVIHVIPQEFIVDGEPGIKDPVGICGIKLEVKVHIVTGQVTAAQNLIKCVHTAGMNVSDLILEQIASSEAVLTEDEKEIGVALIDCGGGTTDVAIFSGGSIRYTRNLTVGGDNLDRDIALGLSLPLVEAKKLKEKFGIASTDLASHEDVLKIESVGKKRTRHISRKDLAMIIEPRVEEIFSFVKHSIGQSGYHRLLPAGAVITGGTVNLEGIVDVAEKVLDMPVRIGIPMEAAGLKEVISNPAYSTSVGLVQYGSKNYEQGRMLFTKETNLFQKILKSMKNWFQEFF